MKRIRRMFALLLVLTLLVGLLAGCRKAADKVAPPDQVAEALFDLIIRDDAAKLKDALGFASEADVRREFLGDGENYMDSLASQLISQFEELGATISEADSQLLVDSILSSLSKLTFSADVLSIDEAAGTATVACHISTFSPTALEDAITQAAAGLTLDPDALSDPQALMSAMIHAIADAFQTIEASGDVRDFNVDFVLEEVRVGNNIRSVWVPADAAAFGEAISSAALGE